MDILRIRVSKWGNSLGIRVPKSVVEDLGLSEGSAVEIEPRDGEYIIRPAHRAAIERQNLEEILTRMESSAKPRELAWGSDVGAERW